METYQPRRMGDLPGEAGRRWGDREALVFGDQRWTHAEFAADVDRVARGLIGIGVEPGDKVGIWMTNRPEWLFLMYAIPAVGAVTISMHTRSRREHAQYATSQPDTTALVVNDRSGPIDYSAMVREMRGGLPKLQRLVVLGDDRPEGAIGWDELLTAGAKVDDETRTARAEAVRAGDPMIIIYTSG